MFEIIDREEDRSEQDTVIKVIGIGGAGGNAVDHMIRTLFERQHDVHADRHVSTGTDMCALHDASAGSGQNHPVGFCHQSPKRDRVFISRFTGSGTSRPEDGHLATIAVLREHFEAVSQLFQCATEDLEIARCCPVGFKLVDRVAQLCDQSLAGDRPAFARSF